MKQEPIDKVLQSYFKENKAAADLPDDFDAKVMVKLKAYAPEEKAIEAFNGYTTMILLPLIFIVALAAILYFFNPGTLALSESFNIKVDLTFFQQEGVKYMTYAFAGLIFFAALDKLIQMKTHSRAK